MDKGSSDLDQTIPPFYITGPPHKWATRAGVSKPVADEFEAVHRPVKAAMEALSGTKCWVPLSRGTACCSSWGITAGHASVAVV